MHAPGQHPQPDKLLVCVMASLMAIMAGFSVSIPVLSIVVFAVKKPATRILITFSIMAFFALFVLFKIFRGDFNKQLAINFTLGSQGFATPYREVPLIAASTSPESIAIPTPAA